MSFIILLHPGYLIHQSLDKIRIDYIKGMSGSPGFLDNGDVGALFYATTKRQIQGTEIGFGLVHTVPRILSTMPDNIREKIPVPQKK
jgi:hypothetical protein